MHRIRSPYRSGLLSLAVLATACLAPIIDTEIDPSTSSASVSVSTTSGPTPTSEPTTSPPPGSTSTDTGTDSTFIVTPDAGSTSTIKCDVFKQDCAEGEKCTAWAEGGGGAWNATKCVKVTGSKIPGDVCIAEGGVSGIDDCEAGVMCWDVNAENMGICVALCKGTPEAPICDAPDFACAFGGEVLNLCLPECDPLVQDCPGEELCLPGGAPFHCVAPAPGNPGQTNDPCELANACAKGLVCLPTVTASSACDPQTKGCCQPFCEFIEGQDGTCPNPDQKCLQWFDPMMEIPPGLEGVGICAIPT